MRFVWIETEKIERNDSIAYMGQVMLEMDDKSEKYIAAVRNNDADDTWTYTVHNRSLIDKNPKVDLETYETYQDFEAARNSTYGIYFLMCRLFVLAETDGLDEYNNQIVDDICDLYQNASDGKLVALVRFDEKVIDWNQEREDNFFENLQAKKKAVLDFVNKHVNKQSKIGEVEAMKEDFEKTATQKIRRFKYQDKGNYSSDINPETDSSGKTDGTMTDATGSETGSSATGSDKGSGAAKAGETGTKDIIR